ncbi:hypothetical protein [Sphingomonas sp.]|uniref:hypothetical protein n=1 Tax=Sphingomonas sp. TaxID=28214 RepID=UPI003B3AE54B
MDPRVERLTKRQIELLHHVFLGRKTWEIAKLEGIAEQTVANRIYEARSVLGGVDRRTAALIVAEAKGWVPGIKPTPLENTLPGNLFSRSSEPVSHGEGLAARGDIGLQPEGDVFVQTLVPEQPVPLPGRRNQHDVLTRISMLCVRIAILVAATVVLLSVYGRA